MIQHDDVRQLSTSNCQRAIAIIGSDHTETVKLQIRSVHGAHFELILNE